MLDVGAISPDGIYQLQVTMSLVITCRNHAHRRQERNSLATVPIKTLRQQYPLLSHFHHAVRWHVKARLAGQAQGCAAPQFDLVFVAAMGKLGDGKRTILVHDCRLWPSAPERRARSQQNP